MKNSSIDTWLQQSSHLGEIPFDENDWNEMKKLLQKKKKRRFIFWWIFSCLLIGTFITGIVHYKRNAAVKRDNIKGNTEQNLQKNITNANKNKGNSNLIDTNRLLKNKRTPNEDPLPNLNTFENIDKNLTTKSSTKNKIDEDVLLNPLQKQYSSEQYDGKDGIVTKKEKSKKRSSPKTSLVVLAINESKSTSSPNGLLKITKQTDPTKNLIDSTDELKDTVSIYELNHSNTTTEQDSMNLVQQTVQFGNDSLQPPSANNKPDESKKSRTSNSGRKQTNSYFLISSSFGNNHPFSNKLNPGILLSYYQPIVKNFFIAGGAAFNRAGAFKEQTFFEVVAKRQILGTTLTQITTKQTTIQVNASWAVAPFIGFQYKIAQLSLDAGVQFQQIQSPKTNILSKLDSFMVQGNAANDYTIGPAYSNTDFTGKQNTFIYSNFNYTIKNKYLLGVATTYLINYSKIANVVADKPKKLGFAIRFGIKLKP